MLLQVEPVVPATQGESLLVPKLVSPDCWDQWLLVL